jgi:hypothetical protein
VGASIASVSSEGSTCRILSPAARRVRAALALIERGLEDFDRAFWRAA